MDAREWLSTYANLLGVAPPTDEEFQSLLDLAAEAAHASERTAAPLACWLSARSGRPIEELLPLARQVSAAP
jgi:hypothetical protein